MKIEAIIGIPRCDPHEEPMHWIEEMPVTIEIADRDVLDRLYLAFFETVPCADCRHYGNRFWCKRPYLDRDDTTIGPLGLIGKCGDYQPKGDDDED